MARQKKDGHFLNCYIRKDIWDEINEYSQKTFIPKTNIVEQALVEYFEKHKIPEKKRKNDVIKL